MFRRAATLLSVLVVCGLCASAPAAPAEKTPPPKEDYYELYKLLVDTLDQVERNYVKDVDRRQLVEAAIEGVLKKLDPYSSYVGPDELSNFRAAVENEFGGIGIQVSMDEGQLKVLSPLYGTPAYRAGVLAGDRIVEIDGKATEGLNLDEAVRRLKGKEGTKVRLTVVHPGRPDKEEITLTRERIHLETVLGDRRKPEGAWDYMLDTTQHIGYIRLSAFGRDSAREIRKALEELQKQKLSGLILDLRFNPGGLLNSAIEVSDLFVAQGRIVSTEGRNSPERTWEAQKEGTFTDFPMVVLVNRYSASASEIVAACLQDHKRGVVMGERTWGKGSVQNVIELENGRSALKLTTAAYRRPSGKNIHRFTDAKDEDQWGVMPGKGYDLRLPDDEIVRLIEDRRRRDVLRPAAPPTDNPREKPTEPDPAAGHSDETAPRDPTPAVVDRQLQMALKYLNGELARANELRSED